MAQTFNDFIAECVAYPYSRENYELMKEAAEIDIMSQYLENQAFYAENVAEDVFDVAYTESFFMESASDEQIQAIEESFGSKIKSFFAGIGKKISALIDKIIRFFKKIAAEFSKTSRVGIDYYKKLKEKKLTEEQYEGLGKDLESMAGSVGLKIYKRQKFEVDLGVRGSSTLKYLKYFQVALSNKTVFLGLQDSDDCVDADTLVKVMNKFTGDKKKADFDSTVKLIESARAEGAKSGVEVFANEDKIMKVVDALEKCKKKLSGQYMDTLESEIGSAKPGEVKDVSKFQSSWAMINATVGATLKQYAGYVKYRHRAFLAFDKLLKYNGEKTDEYSKRAQKMSSSQSEWGV